MQNWVVHIDMDAFFASCEQLTRPTLRGRPVLVGGTSGRGVVAGASYEARALGAHSAMPMWQAQKLVGYRGVSVRPRKEVYSEVSRRVFQIFEHAASVVEQVSVDEAFLAVKALDTADAQEAARWATQLREQIRAEIGLDASVGVARGKQAAKIASGLAKPAGICVVDTDEFATKIQPLSVRKLWGVGPVTYQRLEQYGVHTIGQLAALTQAEVQAVLGKTVGLELWQRAQGLDNRAVVPRAAAKQISAEFTYAQDLRTKAEAIAATQKATRAAHRRLQRAHKIARTVSVKLRMADFHIESRSSTLPHATDDYATLEAVALKLLRYPEHIGAIRLVGVGFSGFEGYFQDVLFPDTPADTAAELAVVSPDTDDTSDAPQWFATQDVFHPEFGHGWIQGLGHGQVTVRFETRTTPVGKVRNFTLDDANLQAADPLASLDWDTTETEESAAEDTADS